MTDFSIKKIIGLLIKTLPFLAFRFLIYFGITLAYLLLTGIGSGIGYLIGKIGGNPGAGGVWGGIIGFGAVSTALFFLRNLLLYYVKAGHIAVLIKIMDGEDIPGGRGQIDYAQKVVRSNFAHSSIMFGVDQLIKGVLNTFNRVFFSIATILPIPGIDGVAKFLNSVINLSLTYLDEVILAYHFRTESNNPWKSSQTALILYAQNYKAFLKNAFFMAIFIWALTILVFILALAPAFVLVQILPESAGFIAILFALVFAWAVKESVIEPIGMTALMQVFFTVTEGQEPNPEWEAKLDKLSRKFGEIKRKALDWKGNRDEDAPPPVKPSPAAF